MSLKRKLLTIGVSLQIGILLCAGLVVTLYFNRVLLTAQTGCAGLAKSDLDHIIETAYAACSSRQHDILASLDSARAILSHDGALTWAGSPVSWEARNQVDDRGSKLTLPAVSVSGKPIVSEREPGRRVPIVDEVRDIAGTNCTLFQRMDAQGDMLRIATTVVGKDGKRAIGTYIPTVQANGIENPVLAAVLNGTRYVGRAWVVDSWHIAAYDPIIGTDRKVAGMLYVGVPESVHAEKIRETLARLKVGRRGYAFAVHSARETMGQFVFATRSSENKLALRLSGGVHRERIAAPADFEPRQGFANLLCVHALRHANVEHSGDLAVSPDDRIIGGDVPGIHNPCAPDVSRPIQNRSEHRIFYAVRLNGGDIRANRSFSVLSNHRSGNAQHVALRVHPLEQSAVRPGDIANLVDYRNATARFPFAYDRLTAH